MKDLKNPNADQWQQFPDSAERLGFDMDSGNVTFGEMVDEVIFEHWDELPQFEKIRKTKKQK
jgi:hypothetical protein